MSGADLQSLLETTAKSLESLDSLLPPDTDDRLSKLVDGIAANDTVLNFVLPLLHTVNPGMTLDQLKADLGTASGLFQQLKKLQQDGSLAKMVDFCRRLERRRVILNMVARALG